MRISAKGRYALAAAMELARGFSGGASTTVISIAERLGISKIYLEQVFALLKRGEIVSSQKGAQGGYLLTRPPREISAYDVLLTVETALFQKTEPTAPEKAPQMDAAWIRWSLTRWTRPSGRPFPVFPWKTWLWKLKQTAMRRA